VSEGSPTPLNEPAPQQSADQTAELLRRILDTHQQTQRKRWLEIVCAVILAMTTITSAWCAYQSSRWSGVLGLRVADAGKNGREAGENTIAALQYRTFDAAMLISFIEAQASGDKKLQAFLHDRFRPETKTAVDAWLATDPLNNPNAPQSPFQMPQYQSPQQQEALRQDAAFASTIAEASRASENSDRYVLLTVLYSSVLFIGGISGTFESRKLRRASILIALISFLATTALLATLPICGS
jgi:hypothetical protein